MNRNRIVIGLLLVTTGIILNQLKFENDLTDFFMGAFIGLGIGLLITGLVKPKSTTK